MQFKPTPLNGAYLIELQKKEDSRGFFARLFCTKQFADFGLQSTFVQVNNSLSRLQGTLRGMHYQQMPMSETKLVRCIQGAIYDVILDLRPDSETFGQWYGATLSAENRAMMYVPDGFAHGFLTLQPDTEVVYLVSQYYSPEHERGVRWNDPRFNIAWPGMPTELSDKDRSFPDFEAE